MIDKDSFLGKILSGAEAESPVEKNRRLKKELREKEKERELKAENERLQRKLEEMEDY